MKPDNDRTLSLEHMLSGLGPALFSSIRAPFGIFDKDRRVVWINKSMAFIHRCHPETAIGKRCNEVLKGCGDKCKRCPLVDAIAQGRTQVMEKWMDIPGSGRRWGEVQAYPVRDKGKRVSAVIIIVFETTASKRALQEQRDYSELLQRQLHSGADGPVNAQHEVIPSGRLTRRESDVLRLVTEGYTNIQIAEALTISAHTVKTHINSIFNKLGVSDRTQAAVMAARKRLV